MRRSDAIFTLLWLLSAVAIISAAVTVNGRRSPKEHDPCDPNDERWHSVPDNETAFLFCDTARKKFKLHDCNSNDGVNKIFDTTSQQCVTKGEEGRWLLMAPPNGQPLRKVGDSCVINRDCADGMYCNAGMCSCYLNYIEINLNCVRVTSVCPGTTYYPEQLNGKPKICSAASPCPPGYVCRPESGSGVAAPQDHGFCCLAASSEVCGLSTAHVLNGRPVPCYSPNASESCPAGYVCQVYQPANRHYCCLEKVTPGLPEQPQYNQSINQSPFAPVLPKHAAISQPTNAFCAGGALAYIYDGNPVVCNPTNPSSCPSDYPCFRNEKFGLSFCCQNATVPSSSPPPAVPSPPLPPPPPPLLPLPGLVLVESTSQAPFTSSSATSPPPFPVHIGSVVGGAISSHVADVCGSNSRPFVYDSKPVLCIANDPLSCPIGYSCQLYALFSAYFCCRSSPAAESHLPIEVTTVKSTPAPSSPTHTNFKPPPVPVPSVQTVCGPSKTPYLYEGNPVMCLMNEPNSCPGGYTCDLHFPTGAHFCCNHDISQSTTTPQTTTSATPTTPGLSTTTRSFPTLSNSDGCPPQTYAARDASGVIQICELLLAPDSCPVGTGCLYSALFARYQCCGTRQERSPTATPGPNPTPTPAGNLTRKLTAARSEECPSGQVAYRDTVTNETSVCAPNHADSCPGGYFCQWSQPAGKFMCCGVSAGCPLSSVAYVNPTTWEAQRCNNAEANTLPCPPGYSCQQASDGSRVCCAGGVSPAQTNGLNSLPPLHPPTFEVASNNIVLPLPPTNIPLPPSLPPPGHLCPAGLPLQEQPGSAAAGPGGYRTCSETATCPAGYQCLPSAIGTVCCLTPSNACALPAETDATFSCVNGTKSELSTRYFYDPAAEACRPFPYKGCDEHVNNFASSFFCERFCATGLCPRGLPVLENGKAQHCDPQNGRHCTSGYQCSIPMIGSVKTTICCPSAELICTLPTLPGQPCTSNITASTASPTVIRYFYDSRFRLCSPFEYYGCGGNGNNFETIDECRTFCASTLGGIRDITTSSTVITTTPNSPVNAFNTQPSAVIPEAAQPNTTGTQFFSAQIRCPIPGQMMPADPTFHACRPSALYSCPDGFSCQKTSRNSIASPAYICCGPPSIEAKAQICPNGSEAHINAATYQPVTCNPADAFGCPNGYGCVLSKAMRAFYCCSTATHPALLVEPPPPPSVSSVAQQPFNTIEDIEQQCPFGRNPFLYPGTTKPLACKSMTSTCPRGHSCVRSSNVDAYICCSNKQPEPVGSSTVDVTFFGRQGYPSASNAYPMWPTNPVQNPVGIGQWGPAIAEEAAWTDGQSASGIVNESPVSYGQLRLSAQTYNTAIKPAEPAVFVPGKPGRISTNWTNQSVCNTSHAKQLGEECCAHKQCLYNCGAYKGKRYCVCQRHELVDATFQPPKCSPSCSGWRDGAFCFARNPNDFNAAPLMDARRRIGSGSVQRQHRNIHA